MNLSNRGFGADAINPEGVQGANNGEENFEGEVAEELITISESTKLIDACTNINNNDLRQEFIDFLDRDILRPIKRGEKPLLQKALEYTTNPAWIHELLRRGAASNYAGSKKELIVEVVNLANRLKLNCENLKLLLPAIIKGTNMNPKGCNIMNAIFIERKLYFNHLSAEDRAKLCVALLEKGVEFPNYRFGNNILHMLTRFFQNQDKQDKIEKLLELPTIRQRFLYQTNHAGKLPWEKSMPAPVLKIFFKALCKDIDNSNAERITWDSMQIQRRYRRKKELLQTINFELRASDITGCPERGYKCPQGDVFFKVFGVYPLACPPEETIQEDI